MEDDSKRASIQVGEGSNIQGGMINIGGDQYVEGSVQIAMGELSTQIRDSRQGTTELRAELERQLLALNESLRRVEAAQESAARDLADLAEMHVKAVTAEKPHHSVVTATREGLQKAAENIASVMPVVATIAREIIRIATEISVLA